MSKPVKTKAVDTIGCQNIAIPIGLIRLVRWGMERLGLYDFFSGFKVKGVPLGIIVEVMCVHLLENGSSMSACSRDLANPLARLERAYGWSISYQTIKRGLDLLGLYFEETLDAVWNGILRIYKPRRTDVYVDGSHVPVSGSRMKGAAVGYGGNGVQNQIQFVVAMLMDEGLPFKIEVYPGNWNDPMQYSDFIPQLMLFLKKGSMIVMDNGGADKNLLDEITDSDMRYLTRKEMNSGDRDFIRKNIDGMRYLERGVGCVIRTLKNGKTTYFFFSVDKYIRSRLTAERNAQIAAERLRKSLKRPGNRPKQTNLIAFSNTEFFDTTVNDYDVQTKLDVWSDEAVEQVADLFAGSLCGWFKLESSHPMEPLKALRTYRRRNDVEDLIKSIKNVASLRPLRVWSDDTVRGSMLLSMLAQLFVSMLREELPGDMVERMVDGKLTRHLHRPSSETVVRSMGQLTLAVSVDRIGRISRVLCNLDDLSAQCLDVLEEKNVRF
ncbi:MAG: hypothetical protein IJV47_06365 [Candidatus Methanomethylophilaceae archaeon]|nr:hypothetical protein [Candidatus Methanomethylophilaceae archaeon]